MRFELEYALPTFFKLLISDSIRLDKLKWLFYSREKFDVKGELTWVLPIKLLQKMYKKS